MPRLFSASTLSTRVEGLAANFKQTKLTQLNQRLRDVGVSPITISEIEHELRFLMPR